MKIVDILGKGVNESDTLKSAQKICELIEKEFESMRPAAAAPTYAVGAVANTGNSSVEAVVAKRKKPRHARPLTSLGVRDENGKLANI